LLERRKHSGWERQAAAEHRERQFITLLGGALADQAIPTNAQGPVRVRIVGVLMGFANDAEAKARVQVFEQGL
jgi:hypothetical protein